MSRRPQDTPAEVSDGGNPHIRFRRGPRPGDQSELPNKADIRASDLCREINTVNESAEQFGGELGTQVEEICAQLKAGAYRAPLVRRVEIPKGPGKVGTRPLGIPTVADRLLQRAVARILEAVFKADFLDCSHGFRPGRNPHHALQALREQIVLKKVMQVFEADIRSYFTRINRQWLRKMVAHRIADPVILSLIGKWLNAGAMKDGVVIHAEEGTPQGGPISVMLSNLYLHRVLDLWFEQQVKPRLRGEAHLVRYIDDFVICFQFRDDADRVLAVLPKRLKKFALELEPNKTKLVKFGRFAQREARVQEKRPETFSFLGFTHFGTRNRNGKYRVGRKTEKSRLRRSMASLTELMRDIRHWSLQDQVHRLNQVLRGHYAYYGLAGNWRSLHKVYRFVERYWHKMLCSRSWAARFTWEIFHRLRDRFPLQRPTISLTYQEMQACAVL